MSLVKDYIRLFYSSTLKSNCDSLIYLYWAEVA